MLSDSCVRPELWVLALEYCITMLPGLEEKSIEIFEETHFSSLLFSHSQVIEYDKLPFCYLVKRANVFYCAHVL